MATRSSSLFISTRHARVIAGGVISALTIAGCNSAGPHSGAEAATTSGGEKGTVAQTQPGAEREQRRDPQAAYEPRSEAGRGQALLARMVGTWTVRKTFFPQKGEPVVQSGECTQKMIQGGRFLQSDFVFHDSNGDTTGMGIVGFDPATERFTSVWIDSRSTRFSMRHSEGAFDGEHIALVSEAPQTQPGSSPPRRSRTVAQLEDGDRRLVHRQWSIGADGSERLVMQLEMDRR